MVRRAPSTAQSVNKVPFPISVGRVSGQAGPQVVGLRFLGVPHTPHQSPRHVTRDRCRRTHQPSRRVHVRTAGRPVHDRSASAPAAHDNFFWCSGRPRAAKRRCDGHRAGTRCAVGDRVSAGWDRYRHRARHPPHRKDLRTSRSQWADHHAIADHRCGPTGGRGRPARYRGFTGLRHRQSDLHLLHGRDRQQGRTAHPGRRARADPHRHSEGGHPQRRAGSRSGQTATSTRRPAMPVLARGRRMSAAFPARYFG